MMTIAAYVHSISPILQVCLSKEEIGTKSQESKNLNERNQTSKQEMRARATRSKNVVPHDIPVKRNPWSTKQTKNTQETPILVVLHDFPRCPTTFRRQTHGVERRSPTREQCRSTRHFQASKDVPHDILRQIIINIRLSRRF